MTKKEKYIVQMWDDMGYFGGHWSTYDICKACDVKRIVKDYSIKEMMRNLNNVYNPQKSRLIILAIMSKLSKVKGSKKEKKRDKL